MVCNIKDTVHYSQEFLNFFNPFGPPSTQPHVKNHYSVIILRNLNPFGID